MNTTFKKTADTYNSLTAVKTVRRARRAYVGLHGLLLERAQMRAAQARTRGGEFFSDLVVKGEIIEAQATVTAKNAQATAQTKVKDIFDDGRDAIVDLLPNKAARVAALEAEVDALEAKLNAMAKPAKKAAKAPRAAKAVKADVKADAKPTETIADKYVSYIADVRGYDADADEAVIKKIVDHCGIALQSRDGKFVACSDETERNTVRDSLLVKKLGLTDDTSELDALVMAVCETMSKDRMKNRVTFYYLLAKNEGKLAAF